MTEPQCDGLCLDSADIGVPGYGIAYAHPGCPLHAPGSTCPCDHPNCISYTHERDDHGDEVTLGDLIVRLGNERKKAAA